MTTAVWYKHQLGLFDDPIEAAFRAFHHDHPEVYRELAVLARAWKTAGHKKLGIATLFEVLRWNAHLEGRDVDGFKLNNNYRSRYARLLMANERDLDGLFDTRELH